MRPARPPKGGTTRGIGDFSVDMWQPNSESRAEQRPSSHVSSQRASFARSDTFLDLGASPERKAVELQSLLGNSSCRLKSGASVPDIQGVSSLRGSADPVGDRLVLEHASSRVRVEVDLVLESETCVQGSELRGQVQILVRKQSKKEAPAQLAQPKVRVVGFESIPGSKNRYTFYQCTAAFPQISSGFKNLYAEEAGADGFAEACEGLHVAEFSMHLPVRSSGGAAKGLPITQSGIAVRYIAMVSVKVRDAASGKRSIAHFYRDCEIWPRLDPAVILAPAARPLQSATSKTITMLGDRRVKLTALLHRLTFIAGQRCYVTVAVLNETKKTIKRLTLTLIRTTTVFKPKHSLGAGPQSMVDSDACETSTVHKVVAETVLERGETASKGRAGGKGWWTGVGPGKEVEFSHFVLIPPDALSIARARLLEVEYTIRVTLSAGSLTSDIFVTLPVRVVNFLSIDSRPQHAPAASYTRTALRRHSIDGELDDHNNVCGQQWQQASTKVTDSGRTKGKLVTQHRRMPCDAGPLTDSAIFSESPGYAAPSGDSLLVVANPDSSFHTTRSSVGEEVLPHLISCDIGSGPPPSSSSWTSDPSDECLSGSHRSSQMENLELDDPDLDEELDFVLRGAPDRADVGMTYSSEHERYDPRGFDEGVRHPAGPRCEYPSSGHGAKARPKMQLTKQPSPPAAQMAGFEAQYDTPFAKRVRERLNARKRSPAAAGGPPAIGIVDHEATPRMPQCGNYADGPTAMPPTRIRPPRASGNSRDRKGSRQLPQPPALVSDASSYGSSTDGSLSSSEGYDSHVASQLYRQTTTSSEDNGRTPSVSTVPSVYSCASQATMMPERPLPVSDISPSRMSYPRARGSRPTVGLGLTGGSTASVKGRVAHLEGRIQFAQDTGSAYV